MDPFASSGADRDITCDALRLALVATHLRTVWHPGIIDAEVTMTSLDNAIRDITRRRRGTAKRCGWTMERSDRGL